MQDCKLGTNKSFFQSKFLNIANKLKSRIIANLINIYTLADNNKQTKVVNFKYLNYYIKKYEHTFICNLSKYTIFLIVTNKNVKYKLIK